MIAEAPELCDTVLRREAEDASGLSDWGPAGFAANLGLLLESCRATASLTPAGWDVLHKVVVRHLRNQLYVQAFLTTRGGCWPTGDHPLEAPLVITGLPRTGTTLLHHLLALDPANRVLRVWEALQPVPAGGAAGRAERIRRSQAWLEGMYAMAPGFRAIHPLTAAGPQECDALLQNTFASQHWDDMFRAERYSAWLNDAELADEYRYLARQLAVLSSADDPATGARSWVLKSPSHLGYLDTVARTFPGATIVFCHRDPAEAVASYASLVATVRSPQAASMTPESVGAHVLLRCSVAMRRALAARYGLGEQRFVDVAYRSLVADPLRAVRQLYARVGRSVTPELAGAISSWVAANPQRRFGAHSYNLEQFGLDAARIDAALEGYTARFEAEDP
ncbi:MAG: sulfotransferase family protein [Acidimicrobiales bacterium]